MRYESAASGPLLNRLAKRRKADRRDWDRQKQRGHNAHANASDGENARDTPPSDWAVEARRELLEQITDFLLRNGLDITPDNLLIAHAAMSGSDLALAQKIGERQIAGQPVSQEWLNQLGRRPKSMDRQRGQLDQLVSQLERSITDFAATTDTARKATASYRGEFSAQLDQADDATQQGLPEDMLSISRAMLDTLQNIEASMKQSQTETEELRQRLGKARAEADSDYLTGLPNRRAFERELYSAHEKALGEGKPLYVAIADIDHFKRVNDEFGHETGDKLLRAIAQLLQKYASEQCFVARHGGEEFVMLLHSDSMAIAKDQLERARRAVESRKFVTRLQNRPIGKVTFSAGLADVMANDNPRDALAAADDALYASKEAGRNQVTIAATAD